MSDPLLFVAADPRELSEWVKRWESVRPVPLAVNWARAGKWQGRDVAAIANGAGAERAFTAVIMAGQLGAVCNTGFCGALDPALKAGDIVTGTKITSQGRSFEASLPSGPESELGAVLTVDHVVQTAEEKRSLRQTGASIVEMEAAGAAQAAEDLGVPFFCIRAVSDRADETFANDFNAARTPEGRFSIAGLVKGALASPQKRFGELLRLRKRTAVAAKTLGEFLANCRF